MKERNKPASKATLRSTIPQTLAIDVTLYQKIIAIGKKQGLRPTEVMRAALSRYANEFHNL